MVCTVLDALGVCMGPDNEAGRVNTYENCKMKNSDSRIRQTEVERCNAEHDLWGWKTVPGFAALEGVPDNVRNLHGIYIYRDAYAVAQRQKFSHSQFANTPTPDVLTDVLEQYRKLTDTMLRKNFRRMIVSYQHSIQRPAMLVQGICKFLGLSPSVEQVCKAIGRISFNGGYHADEAVTESTKARRLPRI